MINQILNILKSPQFLTVVVFASVLIAVGGISSFMPNGLIDLTGGTNIGSGVTSSLTNNDLTGWTNQDNAFDSDTGTYAEVDDTWPDSSGSPRHIYFGKDYGEPTYIEDFEVGWWIQYYDDGGDNGGTYAEVYLEYHDGNSWNSGSYVFYDDQTTWLGKTESGTDSRTIQSNVTKLRVRLTNYPYDSHPVRFRVYDFNVRTDNLKDGIKSADEDGIDCYLGQSPQCYDKYGQNGEQDPHEDGTDCLSTTGYGYPACPTSSAGGGSSEPTPSSSVGDSQSVNKPSIAVDRSGVEQRLQFVQNRISSASETAKQRIQELRIRLRSLFGLQGGAEE